MSAARPDAPHFALLHHAVEHHAEINPEHLAVDEGERTITYGELRHSMEQVAAVLMEGRLTRNRRVGLYLENGIGACVAMLGALRAGACYVPIPPSFPAERNAAIVLDSQPFAIVSVSPLLPGLLAVLPHVLAAPASLLIVLDATAENLSNAGLLPQLAAHFGSIMARDALERAVERPPAVGTIEEDLAYILYTSGTTGTPKGVMLSHRNVSSFLCWAMGYFALTSEDRISNHSNISFDLSVFDIFGAFFAGATVCPITTPGDRAYPARFIKDRRITVWFSVPSVLGLIRSAKQLTEGAFSAHLRLAIFCGEALAPEFAAAWLATHPQIPIINMYGPTEAAIACTYHRVGVDLPFDPKKPVPIGRPSRDTEILVLDLESDREAGSGETGRLMICGTQVCPGYWRRPELTALSFRINPSKSEFGARMYDSGDLAYKDAQGILHFVGRRDSQVKVMGHRIELGEIEVVLGRAASVSEAAVVLLEDPTPTLVAAVAVTGDPVSEEQILTHCESLLPMYMVPQRVVFFPSLAKNDNGKLDRKAIKLAVIAHLDQET